jgi:peptide/nickel transport system substrate-binding protein
LSQPHRHEKSRTFYPRCAKTENGSYVVYALDDLFQQQARELHRGKRQTLLHRIQKLAHERVLYLPIYALYFNNGVGPRVQESSLGRIPLHCYTVSFGDIRLRSN